MNKLIIIGNLTHAPELRTVNGDIPVCSFTVAVNHKRDDGVDFFRVTAWRGLGENCAKYLAKGRKVAVVGEVSARAYEGKDGEAKASLEVTAQDVEFPSPREQKPEGEFTDINDDELPFS